MFINAPDLLELLSRYILKTSDIKYKKLYHWIYIVILNVLVHFIHWKTTKSAKELRKKSEKLNIFIENFFCILKNITVVGTGYTYGQIYVIF